MIKGEAITSGNRIKIPGMDMDRFRSSVYRNCKESGLKHIEIKMVLNFVNKTIYLPLEPEWGLEQFIGTLAAPKWQNKHGAKRYKYLHKFLLTGQTSPR